MIVHSKPVAPHRHERNCGDHRFFDGTAPSTQSVFTELESNAFLHEKCTANGKDEQKADAGGCPLAIQLQ